MMEGLIERKIQRAIRLTDRHTGRYKNIHTHITCMYIYKNRQKKEDTDRQTKNLTKFRVI